GHDDWLCAKLDGNLKAMAMTQNALVTKHVVKGKCQLFSTYLACHPEAEVFFKPLMGAYDKSRLNKEAYIKDFTKYASPITVGLLDVDKFDRAYSSVVKVFEEAGFTQCEYITDDETIFQALNMKAAVGALYSGKKNDYFDKLTLSERETIIQASCERLYNAQMGVWNGSLKAELRPIEKVIVNKTRSFTAAPLDTLLGGKVCVDDFNNKFYAHHFRIPSSVGMTKFYGGWDRLLKLMPAGWVYCDADGSQFDSSLSPFLINSVLNLRLHFMEDWDLGEQMLRNLYTEIVYTPIATPDGTIVKKFKGNNSGQPSTVVDNTIMVMMAVHYSLIKNGIEDIQSVCRYVVNGDDLMIAVDPNHEYLLDSMAQDFHQLGLNYNFGSRSRDVKELWFMSHRGIERDGLLIPKLEMERIVSILEWDRADLPEHRLEAICASMIEAWGYDELLMWIRRFYSWVLEQAPYHDLSEVGKAPYISEVALKALYTGVDAHSSELAVYTGIFSQLGLQDLAEPMKFQ
nr:NIb [Platycodon mild mottle virus]